MLLTMCSIIKLVQKGNNSMHVVNLDVKLETLGRKEKEL